MGKTIDLTDGESVTLSLNGETLHIKANSKGTHFIVSTGDNDLSIMPDARNKIFISAETRKISVKQ